MKLDVVLKGQKFQKNNLPCSDRIARLCICETLRELSRGGNWQLVTNELSVEQQQLYNRAHLQVGIICCKSGALQPQIDSQLFTGVEVKEEL